MLWGHWQPLKPELEDWFEKWIQEFSVSGNNSLEVVRSKTSIDQGRLFKKDSHNQACMLKTRYNRLYNSPVDPTFDVDPAGSKPPATLLPLQPENQEETCMEI